jgi:hypothetical protein
MVLPAVRTCGDMPKYRWQLSLEASKSDSKVLDSKDSKGMWPLTTSQLLLALLPSVETAKVQCVRPATTVAPFLVMAAAATAQWKRATSALAEMLHQRTRAAFIVGTGFEKLQWGRPVTTVASSLAMAAAVTAPWRTGSGAAPPSRLRAAVYRPT